MRFRNFFSPERMQRGLMCVLLATLAMLGDESPRAKAAPPSPPSPSPSPPSAQGDERSGVKITLPLESNSVRFAVIGDSGTGARPQYQIAAELEQYRQIVHFDFVIMLGDNIYGSQDAASFKAKFEDPYKVLLDAGVNFYASLGNHDNPNQRLYKPFNMGGKRYYTFKKGKVEFFVLDSNYMDREQLQWLESQLSGSNAQWKICYFHHPLYSHAKFHGSDTDLRARIEPLFEKYNVQVVFSGHEHVYERLKPQRGISYFVLGNSGQLRPHDLKASSDTAKGFDTDQTFALVEISNDTLSFQTISRRGETVDSGVVERRSKSAQATGQN
jgi:predicted phosphodiesterase